MVFDVLQLVLTEIYYDGFHRTFSDNQQITELRDTDNIYAIETPPPTQQTAVSPDPKSKDILILALNKLVDGDQERR